ncbi:MAG: NnrU family protein [Alphaproteobacteria bacterium]
MTMLIAGLIIFFAIHLLPITPLKEPLYNWKGENGYKGVISVISIIGFVLIVIGHTAGNENNLWTPPDYALTTAKVVMPFAFILFVASSLKSNISKLLPHPQLTAVLLWAAVHLIANGDTMSVMIFASFGIYALVDMLATKKAKGATEKYSFGRDVAVVAIGLGLFVVAMMFHQYLSGMPLI